MQSKFKKLLKYPQMVHKYFIAECSWKLLLYGCVDKCMFENAALKHIGVKLLLSNSYFLLSPFDTSIAI